MSLITDVMQKTFDKAVGGGLMTQAQADQKMAEWHAAHPGGIGAYLKHLPIILGAAAGGPLALGAAGASAAGSGGTDTSASPLDGGGPDPAALQSLYDMYLGPGNESSPAATTGGGGTGGTGGVLKNVLSFIGKNPLQAAQVGLAGLNAIQANKLKSQQFRLMNQGLNRVNTAADAPAPSLNLRTPGGLPNVQAMVGGRP